MPHTPTDTGRTSPSLVCATAMAVNRKASEARIAVELRGTSRPPQLAPSMRTENLMHVTRILRTLAALVAVAVAAPSMAATELVVWYGYRAEEKAAFEKVVAKYNAKKGASGVHVTTLAVPFDAFADKLTASVP